MTTTSFFKNLKKISWPHLNALDIVVGVAIVLVACVFLYLRFSKKTEWITVRIAVEQVNRSGGIENPQYWFVDDYKVGMAARNTVGERIAEITNIDTTDKGAYQRRTEVDVKLKVTYDANRQAYLYNYKPLVTGTYLDLNFDQHFLGGLIVGIGDKDSLTPPLYDKTVEVKVYGLKRFMADQYQPGMEMKDSLGRTVATIEKVDNQATTWKEFSDSRGRLIDVFDERHRDLTITLKIKTYQSNGVSYFVDQAVVKIGEEIWFQFPHIAIRSAIISNISE